MKEERFKGTYRKPLTDSYYLLESSNKPKGPSMGYGKRMAIEGNGISLSPSTYNIGSIFNPLKKGKSIGIKFQDVNVY